MTLTKEKLNQASELVAASEADVWITFVRETASSSDPVLPLILDGGLTWQSALIVTKSGKRIAILGNFDADPLVASGDWDEVIPYIQSIREPLLQILEREVSVSGTIAMNFSESNDKADGLSHGMFLAFCKHLVGSRFETSVVSAEKICGSLRGLKTPSEIARIRLALEATDQMFEDISAFAKTGITERAVFNHVHQLAAQRGLGFSWDPNGDPIVNSGPNSMVGHGIPSDKIQIEEGHIFHVDLGLLWEGYASDIQRSWYVNATTETEMPGDVQNAFEAVYGAISAGAAVLEPGVCGWEVDAAARSFLVARGYPEYMHAFGHQVGRFAHDGGAVLGPKWDRYGNLPITPINAGEVYTLELGVDVIGRGYLGIEEMVQVTDAGIEWLSERQDRLWVLKNSESPD
jgi:Xaa-Pro aminopeptidase